MKIIKMTCFSLLALSFSALSEETVVYSISYTKCIAENINNPMSTECIDSEIDSQKRIINEYVSKHHDVISPESGNVIDLNLFSINQQKFINDRCSLWLKTGGQNGFLLEKQCILDETISLEKLLNSFVRAID